MVVKQSKSINGGVNKTLKTLFTLKTMVTHANKFIKQIAIINVYN
jgi:hypothetical protein